jgi:NAD(P)-dependent dehydrogenase (short-subunit alcohol dehydrogenase family)
MGPLQGKVVIVTGASTGMGRAIAVGMAARRARLSLVARTEGKLDETAAQARALGAEVLTFVGDVADPALAKRVIDETVGRFGSIQVLVNNAGVNTYHRNLADTSIPDWRRVIDTNLTGAFLFTRYALSPMRAARSGHIINISSGAGLTPSAPGGVAYSASKHGIHALTGSINLEERRHGIKASVIAPGEVDTPNLDVRPRPPSKADLAKMLRPEDIANAVIYVASQPEHVSIDLIVITPTIRRDYQADYERYVREGHTQIPLD